MNAPTIRYWLSSRARAWPAWEYIWEALDGGEWHRGADLVEQVMRDGIRGFDPEQMRRLLAEASRQGLLERETRKAAAFNPQSTTLAGPRRRAADPWYRRSS